MSHYNYKCWRVNLGWNIDWSWPVRFWSCFFSSAWMNFKILAHFVLYCVRIRFQRLWIRCFESKAHRQNCLIIAIIFRVIFTPIQNMFMHVCCWGDVIHIERKRWNFHYRSIIVFVCQHNGNSVIHFCVRTGFRAAPFFRPMDFLFLVACSCCAKMSRLMRILYATFSFILCAIVYVYSCYYCFFFLASPRVYVYVYY